MCLIWSLSVCITADRQNNAWRGKRTLEFLENYRRHVLFLAKQLRAFEAVLKSALKRLPVLP
jgi:hypothetical protein